MDCLLVRDCNSYFTGDSPLVLSIPLFLISVDISKVIKKTAGYDIAIVIMVIENKAKSEDKYKSFGFKECIIKLMNKVRINDIVLKYLRTDTKI